MTLTNSDKRVVSVLLPRCQKRSRLLRYGALILVCLSVVAFTDYYYANKDQIFTGSPTSRESLERTVDVVQTRLIQEPAEGDKVTEPPKEQDPNIKLSLSSIQHPDFLPDYKNPCWLQHGRLACVAYAFLGGFQKCGTTDLYNRLQAHPLIVSGKYKEFHYLTREIYSSACPLHLVNNSVECHVNEYTKYFSIATMDIQSNKKEQIGTQCYKAARILREMLPVEFEQVLQKEQEKYKHPFITLDGSASTCWDTSRWEKIEENKGRSIEDAFMTPDLVKRINPNSKVIVLLRDPVSRAFSDYKFFTENATLEEFHERSVATAQAFLNCTRHYSPRECFYRNWRGIVPSPVNEKHRALIGLYHTHLSLWLERLPRDRFLVLRSEDYNKNMTSVLQKCFEFLDLPPLSQNAMDIITNLHIKNPTLRTIGDMWPETEKVLQELFAEEKKKLAQLLGDERFSWKDVQVKVSDRNHTSPRL